MWEKNGKITYNRDTDTTASGMYNKSGIKGLIQTLPEIPGLLVYAPGHIGVYIGNGEVVEARGFAYGIVRTRVAERTWTHWCTCPWLSYQGYESMLMPEAFGQPYTALVQTKSSPLNIWDSPDKKLSLLRVGKGDKVRVADYGGMLGWLIVEKDGVRGYADAQYLLKIDDAGNEDNPNKGVGNEVPTGEHLADDVLYRAKVVNVKTGLNLRTSPNKADSNTILLLPLNAMVEVLDESFGAFVYCCYGGVYGYCTRSYLYRLDDVEEAKYSVTLEGITEDLLQKVLALFPAAIVAEA